MGKTTINKCCHYCDRPVLGRIDKKFCSDHCRISHNNDVRRVELAHIRRINNRLAKNYRILKSLIEKEHKIVHMEYLLQLEFDFAYLTRLIRNKEGLMYYFCYDIGYTLIHDKKLHLIKEKEIMC